jgi:CubicO group peptidase (beta-lactamase class C family)
VIHDDAIVYERYFHGVSSDTELPGFSMSKTYAAALIGRALDDGLVGSLDQPLVSYLPELANRPGYPAVTLEQLLRMTSGIDFDEESIDSAKLYYTYNLRDFMYSYEVTRRPGQYYLYGSVNVQLWWAVLQRRLGAKSISQYFEEQVWQPLGATHAASWSLDSADSGIEKLFGGFNATARDHARLGLLFLHGGTIHGRELLSKEWVELALTPDPIAGWVRTSDGLVRRSLYQWFLTMDGRAFFAKGYNGQYIFVVPEHRAVFVRFGEGYGGVDWTSFFLRLADDL